MDWKNAPYTFSGWEKHLQRIETKQQQLEALRPLPAVALQKIRESLHFEWTYNSNGIEGNSLTLQETKLVILDGMTVKGKSLREHFEAINHQDAILFIEKLAQTNTPLKTTDILDVHALVLQKIEREFAGRFRNAGVRIAGANFTPPNALKIDALTDDLLDWLCTAGRMLNPVIQAAVFHPRFVWIHPFFDGNGRTARLLSNLILLKTGYPPAIILKNDRKKYYDALNRANTGQYDKLLLLFMQATERSLDIYISNLTNTYDDYSPLSDLALEPDMPYGEEYLSLLARQGKIGAFKEGRNWVASKKAVQEYMNLRTRQRKVG
ncbi:MAG: Fic family protein [Saprospiraceae bacterium]|nr:Fic family protein [Saprospiraceae bacterium]